MKQKLLLISSLLIISTNASAFDHKLLKKTDKSWDGQKLEYLATNAEISAVAIKIKAGETMPYHCHPTPSFGQMTSGELLVEKMNGEKKIFKKGDIVTEVVGVWHRGTNLSKIDDIDLVVFYAGSKGIDNTILYSSINKNKCTK